MLDTPTATKEDVMKFAGIDPGLSGGVFFYDTNTEEIATLRFSATNSKLDIEDLLAFLQFFRPEIIYIEQIFLAGREGGRSALTIGANYGRITAVLDAIGLTYTEITPRAWQSSLGLKSGSRAITKQAASDQAVKRFGLSTFLEGRARKPHDGLTDAACIVLFAINKQSEHLWDSEQSKRSNKRTSKRASGTDTQASKLSCLNSKSTTTKRKLNARSQRSQTPKKSSKSNSLPSKKNGTR